MKKSYFLLLFLFSCNTVKVAVNNADSKTYAVFKEQSFSNNSLGATYLFYINGQTYTHNDLFLDSYIAGDKFELMYDSIHPQNCQILFDKPIFLPDENKDIVAGRVIKIYTTNFISDYCGVVYQYRIRGRYHDQRYERAQVLASDYSQKYPLLHEGALFEVEYLKANPQRSKINFEKPVTFDDVPPVFEEPKELMDK